MMVLPRLKLPPGLYRQQTVSGTPHTRSRKSTWVTSSRLIYAPICQALRKSCSGVTLDENITSLPVIPAASDKSSSE